MTDDELKALVASLAVAQKEAAEERKKTDRQMKETDRQMQETDRQLKNLGRQLGGLGEKFGGFTEGMAYPSMQKILRKRFGMEIIAPNVQARRNGDHMEMDVFAYTNGAVNRAVVVEVKSRLRREGIDQMLRTLERFPRFFPEHADKELVGIIAGVDISDGVREQVFAEGLYLAHIHDDLFDLQTPPAASLPAASLEAARPDGGLPG